MRQHKRESLVFGLTAFALTFLLSVGVASIVGLSWRGGLLMGTALSSHTLLAYPIVKRLGLVNRRPIVAAIGGTVLTDTLALIVLAFVVQTASTGESSGLSWLFPLLALAVLAIVSLLTLPHLGRYFFNHARPRRAEKALFVFVVLLGLASATELIGTEAILGAFLAGLCLNSPLKKQEELHEHVQFVGRMLFIPFFFIDTGMRLALDVFTGHYRIWLTAALLLGAIVIGKGISCWLCGWFFNYSKWDRTVTLGLTIPQAAATLAVTVTASREGLFDYEMVDAVIVVIFITCLIGPLISSYAGKKLAAAPEPEVQTGGGQDVVQQSEV